MCQGLRIIFTCTLSAFLEQIWAWKESVTLACLEMAITFDLERIKCCGFVVRVSGQQLYRHRWSRAVSAPSKFVCARVRVVYDFICGQILGNVTFFIV